MLPQQLPLLTAAAAAACVNLSSTWHHLGPFPLGTRESEWGADPLERFSGGFRVLSPSGAEFTSSLAESGAAVWSSNHYVPNPLTPNAHTITPNFTGTNWTALRGVYGWSALQYSAWSRGELKVCGARKVRLWLEGATGEVWVGDTQFWGGDWFGYRRAPVVLDLQEGTHEVSVRISGDVRAYGAVEEVGFQLLVEEVKEGGIVFGEVMVADVVGGLLVGQWASVGVRNEGDDWVEVLAVEGKNGSKIGGFEKIKVAPGQSRPVKFRIMELPRNSTELELAVKYRRDGEKGSVEVLATHGLNHVNNWWEPQKYTFLHPSGIVSYAVLRPPSPKAPCTPGSQSKLPVLLSLHGAGVDADSQQNKEAYDKLPDLCAWLVLPSGVTTWSGDDWHIWGFADVEAAIAAIPEWMKQVNWTRQGVALEKWVVSGHSNGGQGTWYALTHKNDKIIAAAPLSGYLSIPAYVPYHMWHEAEPRKTAMIQTSLSSYRHELLTANMRGTPIFQQHGQDDDNVPVYHSRRMHQLVGEENWYTDYYEVSGKGHWWEGVMTEGSLSGFLTHFLNEQPSIPELPYTFSMVVANPGDTGSRGGIVVDQLAEPDRIGRINVERHGDWWHLSTSNIRRWHFDGQGARTFERPFGVIIDDYQLPVGNSSATFLLEDRGDWIMTVADLEQTTTEQSWKAVEKSGPQWGAMDAFLASKGRFTIVVPPDSEFYKYAVASDVSRNLYQYFAADTEIVDQLEEVDGNVVLIGRPSSKLHCSGEGFPITISEGFIAIRDAFGRTKKYKMEKEMGAIFTCPLSRQRLMLVVWGADEVGLRTAARLVPLRTGVGQPNFVIVGREMRFMGAGGAKAMGMFDSTWQVSAASYL
ncbi:hypothetical protein FN846DRAFT_772479 [Sphaerosporella brunnea]|uniref:Peptidase S9 prolyl oligopeptidase catalytic domain-containing protein n=1 Tax=Sphaerosporella brunnea TaxID=1250544 RepID=A0A5J5F8N5_9PEZI|nr:hypothetical protein FN846DRAFT_772450 [Sphaerosporella brunnea]KAA8913235.1 hypothetical protein FN846DRAFT_772479 [Sphaerosporella brunnea]